MRRRELMTPCESGRWNPCGPACFPHSSCGGLDMPDYRSITLL